MRELRVELLRLRSRRAVVLLVLAGLLGCLLAIGFAVKDAVPPGADERAAAQAMVDRQSEDPDLVDRLDQCRQAVESGDTDMYPEGFDCEQLKPRVEWFLGWQPPIYLDQLRNLLMVVALILTLTVAVSGVTSAGAEWSTGTIGTQLLFEPRRGRVYAGKAGALALAAAVVAVIGVVLAWVAAYWMSAAWGSTEMVQYDPVSGEPTAVSAAAVIGRAIRAVALVVGGAVGGFGLAMLFRSSLAAVGLVAAYGLVGEAVLRAVFRGIEPYVLSTQVAAFLDGEAVVRVWPSVCGGGACEPEVIRISAIQGGITLGLLLAVVLAASLISFRRRDV